ENSQQVFKRHWLRRLSTSMDVCRLHPGELHLGRSGRRHCSSYSSMRRRRLRNRSSKGLSPV
ncbi:hypothetical protein GOODEAATRI_014129, partial [Goodea atripinnis]